MGIIIFLCFQVVRHLIAAGHVVHVVTGAPDYVYTTEINSPNLHLRKVDWFSLEVIVLKLVDFVLHMLL